MNSDKTLLQDLFPEEKLMTMKECFDFLGWEYNDKGDGTYNEVKCCGQPVKAGGWVGIEHGNCVVCDKGMQDVTGILPNSNSAVWHIDYDKVEIPEDGRVWIPKRVWE